MQTKLSILFMLAVLAAALFFGCNEKVTQPPGSGGTSDKGSKDGTNGGGSGDELSEVQQPKKVIVFLHGLNSSSETCWKKGTVDFRENLKNDPALADWTQESIDYSTKLLGKYNTVDAAEEALATLKNRSAKFPQSILGAEQILFVAHSLGGNVLKQILVSLELSGDEALKGKRIGVALIASPARGSDLKRLAELISPLDLSAQVNDLDTESTYLDSLDRNFFSIVYKKRDWSLSGIELLETDPIPPLKSVVVDQYHVGKYFGPAVRVPNTNHFTIAATDADSLVQRKIRELTNKAFQEREAEKPYAIDLAATLLAERDALRKGIQIEQKEKVKEVDIITLRPGSPGAGQIKEWKFINDEALPLLERTGHLHTREIVNEELRNLSGGKCLDTPIVVYHTGDFGGQPSDFLATKIGAAAVAQAFHIDPKQINDPGVAAILLKYLLPNDRTLPDYLSKSNYPNFYPVVLWETKVEDSTEFIGYRVQWLGEPETYPEQREVDPWEPVSFLEASPTKGKDGTTSILVKAATFGHGMGEMDYCICRFRVIAYTDQ
jgi:hypothetical protein